MSYPGSPTPTTAQPTLTDLFPSSTASRSSENNRPSTNVYYLVFLGVLVILLLIAACLAIRAFRIRQRYRTATQLALARGGPLPDDPHANFWGLTQGWASEASPQVRKRRWERIPTLWETEVYQESLSEGTKKDGRESPTPYSPLQPIMLASRRDKQQEVIEHPIIWKQQNGTKPLAEVDIGTAGDLSADDAIRLAMVIQMPVPDLTKVPAYADDRTAWESGMEFGVWEGRVDGGDLYR